MLIPKSFSCRALGKALLVLLIAIVPLLGFSQLNGYLSGGYSNAGFHPSSRNLLAAGGVGYKLPALPFSFEAKAVGHFSDKGIWSVAPVAVLDLKWFGVGGGYGGLFGSVDRLDRHVFPNTHDTLTLKQGAKNGSSSGLVFTTFFAPKIADKLRLRIGCDFVLPSKSGWKQELFYTIGARYGF